MNKYAIVYYSQNGTTQATVERIKKEVSKGIDVYDVKNLRSDLNRYEKIFIGTGIYMGQIPGKIRNFLAKNQGLLASKKLNLFVHGLISEANYLDVVNQSLGKYNLKFDKIFYLGGKLDITKQNFLVKALLVKIAKDNNLDPNNADNLNQQKIAELIKSF